MEERRPRCHLCGQNHPIKYCKKLLTLSVELRRLSIENKGYCLNCLAHSHNRSWCTSRGRCGVQYENGRLCNARHHTYLHRSVRDPYSSSFEDQEGPSFELTQMTDSELQVKEGQPTRLSAPIDTALLKTTSIPHKVHFATPVLTTSRMIVPLIRVNLNYGGAKMFATFLLEQSTQESSLLHEVARMLPDFKPTINSKGELFEDLFLSLRFRTLNKMI